MFYQHPEIKGSIRNLRQYYRESAKMNVFSYDIYLNDKLVLSEDFDFSSQSREQALNSAIAKHSVGIASLFVDIAPTNISPNKIISYYPKQI
ncbi:MAG: hypothetical protein HEQ33_11605 [Dolichospermum sp. WA123]|nr:hypothetical protein [Dolichospermum sp. WA123]